MSFARVFVVAALLPFGVVAVGCDDGSAGADDDAGSGGASGTGQPSTGASEDGGPGGGDSGDGAGSAGTGEGAGGTVPGEGGSDAASTGTGAGGAEPADPCPSFASQLVEVTYGPGAGFGQDDLPGIVLGPPVGGGCCQGSLDVLSLGNGGSITLGFHETVIVDGEGPDLIVFENAFFAGGDPESPFVELGAVEVSADGETWHRFDCDTLEAPWDACAGVTPVYAGGEDDAIDPLDPAESGGDAYDLATVGLAEARFVRIVDRVDQTGFGGTFDLDAVGVVNGRCDAAPAPRP